MRKMTILGTLLAVAIASHAASPGRWVEARDDQFRVVTDGNDAQARQILEQFERIRWMFGMLFPGRNGDSVEPITVVAAKNTSSFQALEPAEYLAGGQLKLAGIFSRINEKNYVLLRLNASFERPFASVYHEYTHLQFRDEAEWMPLWLSEGLAGFFQNTEITGKEVRLGAPSAESVFVLRRLPLIPLNILFRADRGSPYYHEEQKGSLFYAESWALTHYLELTDRESGSHHINDYLEMARQRVDPVEAAEKAFGDLRSLQDHLTAYIRANQYRTFALSPRASQIDTSKYALRELTPIEADAMRAEALMSVHRDEEARALAEEVLQRDPRNVQASETMGALERRAGHAGTAFEWYRAAIRGSSQDYFVQFSFASLAMAGDTSWDDPEIERSLRTALRLNPRYYPASQFLATLLTSFQRDDEAIAVLERARRAAVTSADADKAQARIASIDRTVAERRMLASKSDQQNAAIARAAEPTQQPGPKHPAESANGPKHVAKGTIRNVECNYPAIIDFRVEGSTRTVRLYSNDFTLSTTRCWVFFPRGTSTPATSLRA
jgi:tetratricopeptide (TPR) repeat protein